ncbi:NAD-dependent epimerase/dehydratase family protein [Candidatus Nomurabacteria bacterium]|nr:NAD-dependent epimerase/dehydratase family protein [Candidatus Nomurabacteria bacterium]
MKKFIKKPQTNTKLIIVAGAAGEIGTEFIKKTLDDGHDVIGVIRKKEISLKHPRLQSIVCNLDDANQIHNSFSKLDFSKYSHITYLHTIGVDKFNARNYPNISKMSTIDPDVYDTNVNSFKYLLRYLVNRLRIQKRDTSPLKLKIVALTGSADKYTPFVIEDFCEAKFIIREYIRSYISRFPGWIHGLCINVTSTITESALAVRPFAETTYWLTPEEVVNESYSELITDSVGYNELDVIKYSPDYIEGYYEDNEALYQKWGKEVGII